MGCACGNSSTRSTAGREASNRRRTGSAEQWEVTYNDGSTIKLSSESEAQAALAMRGGGYRRVS